MLSNEPQRIPRMVTQWCVLMHLLALGAFWPVSTVSFCISSTARLNAPYGSDLGGVLKNVACNLASTPSRLEAASLRYRGFRRSLKFELRELHAKVSGVRCFLTVSLLLLLKLSVLSCLNAPFGARCFLTCADSPTTRQSASLNAPFGARCFLTWIAAAMKRVQILSVLMHLMPLGDF